MSREDLNERLRERHKPKKEKKRVVIPTYDTKGRTITPELKRRKKRMKIFLITLLCIAGFLYLPQFFMPKAGTENANTTSVKVDKNAVKTATAVLQDNPDEDFDEDGLSNADEARYGTDQYNADTDSDGVYDVYEINTSKTDPTVKDMNILVDAQTRDDENNGKDMASPYKIGDVILWASDYSSKAHGAVVARNSFSYHFANFTGYAQFPEDKGNYAYVKEEDGSRQLLPHREAENAWKIPGSCDVELYDKPLEQVARFSFLSFNLYMPENSFLRIAADILPDRGIVSAKNEYKADVTPDTKDAKIVSKIVKPSYDSTDTYRFTVNSTALTDLQYVRKAIQNDQCIAVSLYSKDKGEAILVIYGYDTDGNLLVADPDTLKPVGQITITPTAKKVLDGSGKILVQEYFRWEGFGFQFAKRDRICFFASSSDGMIEKSDTGADSGDKIPLNEGMTALSSSSDEDTESDSTDETNGPTESKNKDKESKDVEAVESESVLSQSEVEKRYGVRNEGDAQAVENAAKQASENAEQQSAGNTENQDH